MLNKVQSGVLTLLIILSTPFVAEGLVQKDKEDKVFSRLVLLPFNSEEGETSNWFSESVADLVRLQLRDLSPVLIPDKVETLRAVQKAKITFSEQITYKKLKTLRAITNADWVVVGVADQNQQKVQVKVKMISLSDPENVKDFKVRGKSESISLVVKEVAAELAKNCDLSLTRTDKEMLLNPDGYDLETLTAVYQARRQIKRGHFKSAKLMLEEALNKNPGFLLASLELAEIANLEHQQIRAVAVLRNALDQHPNSIQLLLELGKTYQSQGKTLEAKEAFEKVLLLSPYQMDALYHLTHIFMDQELFELALEMAQRGIQDSVFKSRFYNLIGHIYQRKEDLVFALEMFKKALALDPTNEEALKNQGIIYALLGDYETAQDVYQQALMTEKRVPKRLNNEPIEEKAVIQKNEIQVYLEQLNEDPNNVLTLNALGTAYEQNDELLKAEKVYLKAIEINKAFQPAYFNLAVNQAHQDKFDAAVAAFKKAIELNPGHLASYLHLGGYYLHHRKPKDAAKIFEKGLKQLPKNKKLVEKLVHTYARMNQWRNVIKTYKRYAKNSGQSEQVSLMIGRLFLQYGEDAKALKYFKKGLKENPESPDHYKEIALFYDFYGNKPDKAVKYYESFLEFETGSKDSEEVQIRLSKLKAEIKD